MLRNEAIQGRPGSMAVLDLGSDKVTVFIAELNETGGVDILGVGHQLAKGIRSGAIQDAGQTQSSIIAAVHTAEQMAEESIESVVVSVNGAHLRSHNVTVELEVTREGVTDADILDLIREGCDTIIEEGHEILQALPVQYYLDKAKGLSDPRGMVGEVLGAEIHIVTAESLALQNLTSCIARCHLNVAGFIPAPYASAMACLTEDERELGVTLIDVGAGTTGVAVFANRRPVYIGCIPVGGRHVTHDLARGLSISVSQAERVKILHANAVGSIKDAEVPVDVVQYGEEEDTEETTQVPRSMITGIVRPRMEEIFEMVRQKLDEAGIRPAESQQIVLTGGSSQMLGVYDLATKMLGKQVRKAKPVAMEGLADSVSGPAFATAVGMLQALRQPPWEEVLLERANNRRGVLKRVISWFKTNI
ncbi:MAG: cell division protein FtsA [Rickettsiales bacterium]|nr:cell division protein FtsA [Rickettsiales bacterium]|tara:strand:- start:482 stop:1738 length:1257 start_codon:yes stop_codon:yes gene_type:complete